LLLTIRGQSSLILADEVILIATRARRLLRCMSPLMSPRVVPLLRIIMSAIGAEPDMRHFLALVDGGAPDPRQPFSSPKNQFPYSTGLGTPIQVR
jgi:hypothetical protein